MADEPLYQATCGFHVGLGSSSHHYVGCDLVEGHDGDHEGSIVTDQHRRINARTLQVHCARVRWSTEP